ncbi:hypothetical protein KIN20_002100 [Parelaphostrongylus tenuis]|uniref:Uncharacterized protein n=1 Tax=Parelaphostrongylus tenuis TaxID=148309 RepID=A0AAD5QCS9_PARTN|nr:hypothetical protein KIN20_002100 [Parelaphostrongylus tenuis]
MSMWILYGCFIVTFFYLLTVINIFETNKSIAELFKKNSPTDYPHSVVPSEAFQNQNVGAIPLSLTQDIFDTCPFVPPDPWDPEIISYIDVKYGFFNNCTVNVKWSPITELRNGRVRLLRAGSARKYECRARCVNYQDEEHVTFGAWRDINDPSPFTCDFVQTECNSRKRTISYVHMQIAELSTSSISVNIHPHVHIILVDSVASSQAIRALPRTVNFLTNAMEAVQFRKLNKVGVNSRPNGFAMLFGKTTEPVMREMVDMEPIPADWTYSTYCRQFLDESIYIPVQYRNAGYKTFGAQDYEASLLNFPNCLGLKQREFQHTYRPFDLIGVDGSKVKNRHENASCSRSHNNMLKYLETFLNSYKDSSKFSLSWVTKLAHDDSGRLYEGDFDLYNFFLRNRQELENSFVFFLGDHGPRFGKETKTFFGRNEANNPFLYVVVPKSLRKSDVFKVLKAKEQELITPHDIHATLKDILEEQPYSKFIDTTFKSFLPSSRGSSLLREFESGVQRNCKTLPIPFQYCICQYAKIPLDDDALAIKLGQFAVDSINTILNHSSESENCSHLILHQVHSVSLYVLPEAQMKTTAIYDVMFQVSPSAGIFQIPIRSKNGVLKLAGSTFTRLNEYGKQSICVARDTLKPLCHCKRQRTENES